MSDFHRAYVLTDTDRSGLVIIVATLLMSWMLLTFMIRLYTRIAITGPFGLDDFFAGIGTLLGTIQVIVVLEGVKQGLGKSKDLLTYTQGLHAAKDYYVSDILFLLANSAAKASVGLLIRRINREERYRRICHSLLAFIAIWTIASAIAVGLECNFHYPPPWVGRCTAVGVRWEAIAVFDSLIEAGLFFMSTYLVWNLQMRLASKAVVVFAFSSRLVVIILSIVRTIYLVQAVNSSDFFLRGVGAIICTQILMHYSLMASTVPCLKPFVISFNTGWGQGLASQQGGSYYKQFGPEERSASTRSTATCSQSGQDLPPSALSEAGPPQPSPPSLHLSLPSPPLLQLPHSPQSPQSPQSPPSPSSPSSPLSPQSPPSPQSSQKSSQKSSPPSPPSPISPIAKQACPRVVEVPPTPPPKIRTTITRTTTPSPPTTATRAKPNSDDEYGYGVTNIDEVMSIAPTEIDSNPPILNGSSERFYSLNSNSSRRLIVMHQRSLELERLRKQRATSAGNGGPGQREGEQDDDDDDDDDDDNEDCISMLDGESSHKRRNRYPFSQRRGDNIEIISFKSVKARRLFSV